MFTAIILISLAIVLVAGLVVYSLLKDKARKITKEFLWGFVTTLIAMITAAIFFSRNKKIKKNV